MPAPLPPLSTNAPCPKCGCTHATVQHRPARPLAVGTRAVEPEHMARSCTRCGYAWRERPLDAPADAAPADAAPADAAPADGAPGRSTPASTAAPRGPQTP